MKKTKSIPDSKLVNDFYKFYDVIGKENDTLCVVVAGALVERCLNNALLRTFRKKRNL